MKRIIIILVKVFTQAFTNIKQERKKCHRIYTLTIISGWILSSSVIVKQNKNIQFETICFDGRYCFLYHSSACLPLHLIQWHQLIFLYCMLYRSSGLQTNLVFLNMKCKLWSNFCHHPRICLLILERRKERERERRRDGEEYQCERNTD